MLHTIGFFLVVSVFLVVRVWVGGRTWLKFCSVLKCTCLQNLSWCEKLNFYVFTSYIITLTFKIFGSELSITYNLKSIKNTISLISKEQLNMSYFQKWWIYIKFCSSLIACSSISFYPFVTNSILLEIRRTHLRTFLFFIICINRSRDFCQ